MPPFRKPNLVTLRRQNPGQAWGFRLAGGAEIGQPFQIQKVTPGSLAFLSGLSEGDELVRIGNISLRGLTHDEVQQIIMRCTHCIDLFIVRDNNGEVQPRFELVLKTPDQQSNVSEENRIQQYEFERQQQIAANESYNFEKQQVQFNNLQKFEVKAQAFNASPKPYSPVGSTQQLSPSSVDVNKPSSPSGGRKIRIKSPLRLLSQQQQSLGEVSDRPQAQSQPVSPLPQMTPTVIHNFPVTTSTTSKEFNFPDLNNNNQDGCGNKVYGLPARPTSKAIAPIGGHGVQPVENGQRKQYFGVNIRQRFNSLTSDRDWKDPLPIVNIPHVDQLLPSQTKQMQTYINQTPPTEKYLKPSLVGLERRRIRPIWPPPHPGRVVNRTYAENRDSPSTKMFNWPPRASSVDRDFGYGVERSVSPGPDRMMRGFSPASRVTSSTRQWPPPSNATPAGRSGYIPDEDEDENYAYNTSSRRSTRESTPVGSHIPRTYRSPPDVNVNQQVIVDF